MGFEPVIASQFGPWNLTGFKPFEPVLSNGKWHVVIRRLISNLSSDLIVLYTNTARTTFWIVARAEMHVCETASAHVIWSRRKGDSK